MPEQPTAEEAAISWLSILDHTPGSPHEALALFNHALLLGHGFRPADEQPDHATSTNPTAHLPSGWGVGGWGCRYRHDRSSLTFEVRATAVAGRLIVNAATVETEEGSRSGGDGGVQRLEVKVGDYVDADDRGKLTGMEEVEKKEDVEERKKRWSTWLKKSKDFSTLVQVNISHRLVPDAAKAGYEAAAAGGGSSTRVGTGRGVREGVPEGVRGPQPMPGPRPVPPLADDPLRIGPPMRPQMPQVPDPFGVGLGYNDLYPAGLPRPGALNPPGVGGLGVGARGGGGSLMGPNHPIFRSGPRDQRIRGDPGRGGLIPPGARYDPYGPPPPPDHTYGDNRPDPARFGNNPDIETPPPPDMYW